MEQHNNAPTARHYSISALAILVLACALRAKSFSGFSTGYLGGSAGDTGIYLYLCQFFSRDFWVLPWFQTNAFYPYDFALARSDNFILPGILVSLLARILSLPAAWNTM